MAKTTTGWIAALSAHTTADNREIPELIVDQLAETYDTNFYTARINLEHFNWFSRFGDVVAVKAEFEDGIKKLFVKLQANELLESINAADQAVFLSVEFVRNFAKTGKAYLTGLALTDQPASIGTGRVSLSVDNNDQDVEVANCGLRLNYENAQDTSPKTGVISNLIKKLNTKEQPMTDQEIKELQEKNIELTEKLAVVESNNKVANEELSVLKDQNSATIKSHSESIATLTKNFESVESNLTELKSTLTETLQDFTRPPATGGSQENDEIQDSVF